MSKKKASKINNANKYNFYCKNTTKPKKIFNNKNN